VDDGHSTVECPTSLVELTIYGLNFQRTALSIHFTDHDAVNIACTEIRVSTDEQLRCTFDGADSHHQPRRRRLDVAVNSSLGYTTFAEAVEVDGAAYQPTITSVSGCVDSWAETRDCTQMSEVRLSGAHYPRWLPPTLVLPGQLELPCQWRGDIFGVYCSLNDVLVDSLPKGQLLPIQVRFDTDRLSPPQLLLAMRGAPSGPSNQQSSTGRPADPAVDRDELNCIKVTLFVACVLSLVAIVGGVAVWAAGLWMARQRSFVSAHGQAAVDTRQVLLH